MNGAPDQNTLKGGHQTQPESAEGMNGALVYLWLALLRRRALRLARSLSQPTTLIGVAAVLALLGTLFWFRREEFFGQLLDRKNLAGCAVLMACASLFTGFLQHGLPFDPPDIEFVFTSPFTRRQIILYRLLPQYLYSCVQGIVFAALFAPHLQHPLLMAFGATFFQITCFHLSTGAAIFAGTLSEALHHRLRWMLLAAFTFIGMLVFRTVWAVSFVPAFAAAPVAQMLFYPAVTLADVANDPTIHHWAWWSNYSATPSRL